MSGEIVNLRRARKEKRRDEKDKLAAANRLAFGRTKAERATSEFERARASHHLEGHRLNAPHADELTDAGDGAAH